MKTTKNLILYRDFENEQLFYDFTWVMENYQNEYYNKEDVEGLFYECLKKLMELAVSHGFSGNLWHNFLAFLLVNNENAYSRACELRGEIKGSINEVARHDFAIMKELFDFDLSVLGNYFSVDCMDALLHYEETADAGKLFNKRIRDRIAELCRHLEAAADAEEFKQAVTAFYGEFGVGKLGLHKAFRVEHPEHEEVQIVPIDDPSLNGLISEEQKAKLEEEIELQDGAGAELDQEMVSKGELSPVFFGSALTNFGVETFLKHFLKMTTSPLPRKSDKGEIDPMEEGDFSAFVFKIQANMNKAHRDRIAFMRICSGEFEAGMDVFHMQGGKKVRLSQPQQMMASERHMVDKAYGGDIIGVFDPGIFSIGDTLTTSSDKFSYEGIPTFAPEHFARVRQVDTMKRKQFIKGINQIAQEGAIQIFQEFNTGMDEIIVGVVGVLQFDVLKYRLENEYNVDIRLENLPYEYIRWINNPQDFDLAKLSGTSDMKKVKDLKDRPLLLFVNEWSIRMTQERNEGLVLTEFAR